THSHNRSPRSYSRDKRIGSPCIELELPPDLGTGRLFVCRDIPFVRELGREKDIPAFLCKFFCHFDTSQKSPFVVRNGNDLCSKASDEVDTFPAHPVGHKDDNLMSECSPNCCKRYTGISTRCLRDDIIGSKSSVAVCAFEDGKSH